MVFTVLIIAFAVILLLVVGFTIIGAIGRGIALREKAPDLTIADNRDGFDPK